MAKQGKTGGTQAGGGKPAPTASGVARFLANASLPPSALPYFVPTPATPYTRPAPKPEAAPVASEPQQIPTAGQPNINAPVGSLEWWMAYNPGADYDRHFGGGGR